jgi:hypothetical protein
MTFDPQTLEAVLREAEALPDARARRVAVEVAAKILDLHRAGLSRMVELLRTGESGSAVLARASADPLVGSLLELHGLDTASSAACTSCALCGAPLAEVHTHLFELQPRTLSCACDACGMLFDSLAPHRYRRVRPLARRLAAVSVSDATWTALGVPVGLAFFRRTSGSGEIVAGYPGPAGAVEAQVPGAAWQSLANENPELPTLEPDVEALLVNRLRGQDASSCYHVSIDRCYHLAGMVRSRWEGISGGTAVGTAIDEFFHSLEERA